MLVLTRHAGESVNLISKTTKELLCRVEVICFQTSKAGRRQVRLGFAAVDDVLILRTELLTPKQDDDQAKK